MSSYPKSRVSSHISTTNATARVRPQEIPETFEECQKREQAAFVLSRTDYLIWHANARNEVCSGNKLLYRVSFVNYVLCACEMEVADRRSDCKDAFI